MIILSKNEFSIELSFHKQKGIDFFEREIYSRYLQFKFNDRTTLISEIFVQAMMLHE
jgi:hypothetical protein